MTPEAQQAMQTFVASQKTAQGYMNAGGRADAYYQQFGEVLEAVFTPTKLFRMKLNLTVQESRHQDTIYGQFFDFLAAESHPFTVNSWQAKRAKDTMNHLSTVNSQLSTLTTNAVCCILSMQHQMGEPLDPTYVEWLQQLQDDSGGFYANELASIPDLLSTAVALFTLRLIGADSGDATLFIQAHWQDNGSFSPTLLDDYSDVEYVFYGLLALGSLS